MSATTLDLVRRAFNDRLAPEPAAELLSRYARARDPEAFAALVKQFGPLVLGVCRRVLGPSPDADDAFQTVFMALARQAHSFRDARALPAWLHRVALRTARKALRHQLPNTLPGPAAESVAESPDPLAEAAWKDVRRVLDEELDALPAKVRAPVVLCWLDGLTRDEAARRIGVSRNTLKRRLAAGRDLLRARLMRRGLAPVLVAAAAVAPTPLGAEVPRRLLQSVTDAVRGLKPAVPLLPRLLALATVAVAVGAGVAFVGAGGELPADTPPARTARSPEGPAEAAELPLPPGAVARFGSTQFRTEGWIGSPTLSPDRTRVAVLNGSTVRVYEAATWRVLQTYTADGTWTPGEHRDVLAFSRDSQRLAYVKNGRFAYVWDLKAEKLLRRIDNNDLAWQGFCAFTPDGSLALAEKEKLRFFDPASGAEKHSVAAVGVVALSPDGKRFVRATCGEQYSATVALCDAHSGKELYAFETVLSSNPAVSFSPDGKRLALVTKDGTLVEVWNADRHTRVGCFNAPPRKRSQTNWAYRGGFTPDGDEVWLQLPGGDLARWDAETGRELPTLVAGTGPYLQNLFPLSDGRTLLAPCGDWVRVFDRATGKERSIPGRYRTDTVFAVSPDGTVVAVGGASGRVDLLDGATGKPARTLRERGDDVTRLAFGPDGAVLAVGDARTVIEGDPWSYRLTTHAISVADGKERWSWTNPEEKERGAGAAFLLGFAPGERALFSDPMSRVLMSDTGTGKERFRIAVSGYNTAIAPDGKVLAVEDYGEVVLFDLDTGRESKRIEFNPEQRERKQRFGFAKIAWSADARTMAVTLPEDVVCVLDPVAGKELAQFPVYGGKVTNWFKSDNWRDGGHTVDALALSPDGKRLLAAALRGDYVALWDARTGRQLGKLEPGFGVTQMAFSADGKSAFTFGRTGLGYRWDVEKVIAAQKK